MYVLRIGGGEQGWTEFPLMQPSSRPELLKLSKAGSLRENARYQLRVVCDHAEEITDLSITVNGEVIAQGIYEAPISYLGKDGSTLYVYAARPVNHQTESEAGGQILRLIYGFARIEVVLTQSNGSELLLETDDIPVLVRGDYEVESKRVDAMLAALFDAEPRGALQWMLTGTPATHERFSIVEGGATSSAPKSVSTFLQVTSHVLSEFERILSSFKGHARSSIGEVDARIPGKKLRVASGREAFWIATHPDVLQRSQASSGINVGNSYYMPRYVQTGLRARTYNTYENRMIVSFLSTCAQRLGRVSALIETEHEQSKSLERALNPFATEGYILSSLLITDSSARRSRAVQQRANKLRKKAISLLHAYEVALPGVDPVRFMPPRRSKVFQEVAPYTKLYELMVQWCSVGDLDMRGSLLALRTARMDRLYEYYVLLTILMKLEEHGFIPCESEKNPIKLVEYSLADTSRFFRNERHVANKYVLEGERGKVVLFYQPVFYGDEREENGVEFHRTSLARGGNDSYYTPDFMMTFYGENAHTTVAFDAKYRYSHGVMGNSRDRTCETEFLSCMKKYIWESSSVDGPLDALWLLCGRDENVDELYWEQSSWASSQADYIRSGAMSLTPSGNYLDELFIEMGIVAREGRLEKSQANDRRQIAEESDVHNGLSGDKTDAFGKPRGGSKHEDKQQSLAKDGRQVRETAASVGVGPLVLDQQIAFTSSAVELADNDLTDLSKSNGKARSYSKGSHKAYAPMSKAKDNTKIATELVQQLFECLGPSSDSLYKDKWSKQTLRINRPVLRKSAPIGKEASKYVPFKLDGEDVFLVKEWNQMNINKARQVLRRLKK